MQASRLEDLEKRHAEFVALHSSPSRQKFILEFGRSAVDNSTIFSQPTVAMPAAPLSAKMSPMKSPHARGMARPARLVGPQIETTQQFCFRPPWDEHTPASFKPETKHRNRKGAGHDYTEALFLEWNIHGKSKK